jgi:hypothetical protein
LPGTWLPSARAADNPDFAAVSWVSLGCAAGDVPVDVNPNSVDLVGSAAFPSAYIAGDAGYLYFRLARERQPLRSEGLRPICMGRPDAASSGQPVSVPVSAVAEYGVGSDDDFGNSGSQKGDTIEIWHNTVAMDVDFSPLFNDPAEVRLFAQKYDFSSGAHRQYDPARALLVTATARTSVAMRITSSTSPFPRPC